MKEFFVNCLLLLVLFTIPLVPITTQIASKADVYGVNQTLSDGTVHIGYGTVISAFTLMTVLTFILFYLLNKLDDIKSERRTQNFLEEYKYRKN